MSALDEVQLSAILRHRLAPVHAALERVSGLPERIVTIADYIGCLQQYYALFTKLEAALSAYPDDSQARPGFAPAWRAPLLRNDLRRLGAFQTGPVAPMPRLSSFAQALGVRYVLEGSALGGQVILAALQRRLGDQIEGATSFFAGQGRATMAAWQGFKAALDQYGAAHPAEHEQVFQGATLCFGMFMDAATGVLA